MALPRPTTIAEYIRAAPAVGQPHLCKLCKILKSVAPKAEETIKWGTPFFVEPRFLFAFAAYKALGNPAMGEQLAGTILALASAAPGEKATSQA